jgi:hypothetical protein
VNVRSFAPGRRGARGGEVGVVLLAHLEAAQERPVDRRAARDEGRGAEAAGAERLGQRHQRAGQRVARLHDAVLQRRAPGEDRRERHRGDRRRREAARERHAVGRDVVETERALLAARDLVDRHPRGRSVVHQERAAVGAQVLDRDEHHVARLEPRPLATARGGREAGRHGERRDRRGRYAVSDWTHAR